MNTTTKRNPSAMDRALRYLGSRMRSEKELTGHLRQKEVEKEEITRVLSQLKDYGYVDDSAFCREYISQKKAMRPVGRNRLEHDLLEKGILREIIEDALSEYSAEEEQEQCNALFQTLLARKGSDQKAMNSIVRSLSGRGFSYDMIRAANGHSSWEDE